LAESEGLESTHQVFRTLSNPIEHMPTIGEVIFAEVSVGPLKFADPVQLVDHWTDLMLEQFPHCD
jgi:hypothetical protein